MDSLIDVLSSCGFSIPESLTTAAFNALTECLQSDDDKIRLQAVKLLTDMQKHNLNCVALAQQAGGPMETKSGQKGISEEQSSIEDRRQSLARRVAQLAATGEYTGGTE